MVYRFFFLPARPPRPLASFGASVYARRASLRLMRRTVVALCLASVVLGLGGCRRASRAKTDPHLDAGYALLLAAPREALREFERSSDRKGAKEYALAQAYEALEELDAAKTHYERALEQRPGFVKAEAGGARIDLLQGKRDEAVRRLGQVVSKAPDELPSLLLYGVAARTPSDREQALAALLAWPQAAPQTKPPAEYFFVLAALRREQTPAAALDKDAERARSAAVHSVPGALVLARLSAALQRPWLARVLLARLAQEKLTSAQATTVAGLALGLGEKDLAERTARSIQSFPEEAQAELVFGQLALSTGDAPRAIKHLKTSLALLPATDPARTQAELALGRAYLSQKDLEQAALLVNDLLDRSPNDLQIQLLAARMESERGEFRAAVARLERLHKEHPRVPLVLEELARERLRGGDSAGAIQAARQRLAESPSDRRALAGLVELLLSQNQKAQAQSEIEGRLAAEPTDDALWLLLARTTERLGSAVELRRVLERFVKASPKSEDAWLSLARLEEREQHPDLVERALQSALAAHPDSVPALQHLAELSMRQHDWAKAAATYERLLVVLPDQANALNNLAYLYADRLDQPDRAVRAAERAHRHAGDRPTVEDTLGWALVRRGQPADRERALTLLRHAHEFLPQDDVRLHLAVALHQSGQHERARELLVGFRYRADDPGHAFAREALR